MGQRKTIVAVASVWIAVLCAAANVTAAASNCDLKPKDLSIDQGYLYVNLHGNVLVSRSFGSTRLSPRSPFPIGSISKQVTGLAVRMLLKEKDSAIRLDEKLLDLLPAARGSTVTLHDVLQMKAGIQPDPVTLEDGSWTYSCDDPSYYSGLVSRSDYAYSNLDYCVLSKIVEQQSHEDFPTFLKTHFFTPLGMTSTYEATSMAPIPEIAGSDQSCYSNDGKCAPSPGKFPGSAGVVTTPEDFAKWQGALKDPNFLGMSYYRSIKAKLLGAKPGDRDVTLLSTEDHGLEPTMYEYGFNMGLAGKYLELSHDGAVIGNTASMAYYPEPDLFVFQDSNYGVEPDAGRLGRLVLAHQCSGELR